MAAGRPNPWSYVNNHNPTIQSSASVNFTNDPNIPAGYSTQPGGGSSNTSAPPPPPRPSQTQGNNLPLYRNSPFSSYGGYGASNYGSSPYMPYHSGYGMNYGYNGFGSSSSSSVVGDYNSLYRQVEGSSRQAFQSVESIVQAFTSVSMMLDSTFQALYSSFRAVIGVADNLSRLRLQLYNMLSALALIRTLKYLVRKVLEVVGLRPQGHAAAAWREAVAGILSKRPIVPGESKGLSTWPIIMFFGIIVGAPWLIWKLISPSIPGWLTGEDDHYVTYSLYNFVAEGTDELSFSTGQKIIVAPKEEQPRLKGWLLASVDGKKIGIVPANYVKEPVRCMGRKNLVAATPSMAATAKTSNVAKPQSTEKHMDNVFDSYSNAKIT